MGFFVKFEVLKQSYSSKKKLYEQSGNKSYPQFDSVNCILSCKILIMNMFVLSFVQGIYVNLSCPSYMKKLSTIWKCELHLQGNGMIINLLCMAFV
ncbi:hypothetical protein HX13_18645 [Chryseobacterium sp. P1-3]|nr:hypothetical protein HX13_18645 [Chryseobacterium sp. P1-3]